MSSPPTHTAKQRVEMASIITSAAQAAHNVASSILAHTTVQPGQKIPVVDVKIENPERTEKLELKGKNILVSLLEKRQL